MEPNSPNTESSDENSSPLDDIETTLLAFRATNRFRWETGAAILLLGAGVETIVWQSVAPDRTYQVIYSMPVLAATALLLLLWWLFATGLAWSVRLGGCLAAAIAIGVFLIVFRFDGFEGDMFPRFTLRSQPTAEERAMQYWKTAARPAQTKATSAVSATASASKTQLDGGGDHAVNGSSQQVTASDATLRITDADWPQFRGHKRDGVVTGVSIRRNWNQSPPQLVWKHPVGLGWSSFAVVDGLAFTQEQRQQQEAVVCYDFDTGEQIWVHSDEARFKEAMGGIGPRATPTIFDSRVYALGATGILNCLDARTGKRHWTRNILADAGSKNMNWAMSASPLVYDDVVVVSPGGGAGWALVAYDRLTGKRVWQQGDRRSGYAAPRLETIAGQRQLLVFNGDGLCGHDPETGRELWFFEWPNKEQINVAQPIVWNDRAIFFGSGYAKGSALLDVVVGETSWSINPKPRWTSSQLKLKFNDAVARNGYVYGLDEGILVCLDLETGNRQWKRGRYGYGQLLLADDLLVIQADTGEIVLVEANPSEFNEVTRFQAIEGKTWNHPVITRNRLLVRNAREAACFEFGSMVGNDWNLTP